MCERGTKIREKGMDEEKFRFEARIIRYDHGHGRYKYVNLFDSYWGTESTFVLADVSDIKEDKGRVSFVLE